MFLARCTCEMGETNCASEIRSVLQSCEQGRAGLCVGLSRRFNCLNGWGAGYEWWIEMCVGKSRHYESSPTRWPLAVGFAVIVLYIGVMIPRIRSLLVVSLVHVPNNHSIDFSYLSHSIRASDTPDSLTRPPSCPRNYLRQSVPSLAQLCSPDCCSPDCHVAKPLPVGIWRRRRKKCLRG